MNDWIWASVSCHSRSEGCWVFVGGPELRQICVVSCGVAQCVRVVLSHLMVMGCSKHVARLGTV